MLVQLDEHEQEEVDFHPNFHHQKLELETYQGSWKDKKAQSLNVTKKTPNLEDPYLDFYNFV